MKVVERSNSVVPAAFEAKDFGNPTFPSTVRNHNGAGKEPSALASTFLCQKSNSVGYGYF